MINTKVYTATGILRLQLIVRSPSISVDYVRTNLEVLILIASFTAMIVANCSYIAVAVYRASGVKIKIRHRLLLQPDNAGTG